MADNASNMDTFVNGIVSHADKMAITINADWARLQCMPHTIHLATLKVSDNYHFLCPTLTDSQGA
jgi:hypothetical protein